MEDEKRSGQPEMFENAELQALLDENPSQTLSKLSKALDVTPSMAVSKRLYAIVKYITNISSQLLCLPSKIKKSCLWNIITGNEK